MRKRKLVAQFDSMCFSNMRFDFAWKKDGSHKQYARVFFAVLLLGKKKLPHWKKDEKKNARR